MTIAFPSLDRMSDADLLARVRDAAEHERHSTAQLIALLMEVDSRRLYLAEGCSSLFTCCMQVLHLTEHARGRRLAPKPSSGPAGQSRQLVGPSQHHDDLT